METVVTNLYGWIFEDKEENMFHVHPDSKNIVWLGTITDIDSVSGNFICFKDTEEIYLSVELKDTVYSVDNVIDILNYFPEKHLPKEWSYE